MAYCLAEDYLWKELKGRVVVLNLESGKYYSLNSTGSLIWKSLLDGFSFEEIVDIICSTYTIDTENARQDAESMINDFLTKKLLLTK